MIGYCALMKSGSTSDAIHEVTIPIHHLMSSSDPSNLPRRYAFFAKSSAMGWNAEAWRASFEPSTPRKAKARKAPPCPDFQRSILAGSFIRAPCRIIAM